jgi:hypothetical protein
MNSAVSKSAIKSEECSGKTVKFVTAVLAEHNLTKTIIVVRPTCCKLCSLFTIGSNLLFS